jgi:hypothetical protein
VTALYIRHTDRLGRLGMAGFYLGSAGSALAILGSLVVMEVELSAGEGATPEWLDRSTHTLAALLFAFGSVVFGVAAKGVEVLPGGGAALLIAGPLLLLGMIFGGIEGWPLMAPAVLSGAGWAWLAYALLSEETGEQPTGQGKCDRWYRRFA